jgi:phytoene dehydrogenase-like protein
LRGVIVIVGGGHNGLVAATLLARAGRDVLLLERRSTLGGAAASERPFAGQDARLSRYAYLVSLFPDALARDLGVTIALADRSVAAFAPYDGRGLLVGQDASTDATRASFRERTGSDAEHDAFLAFYALLAEAAQRLFPTFLEPLPTRAEAQALLADVPGAWELLAERPLGDSLDERFADELVSGMVSTDGLIGTLAGVHDDDLRQNRCFLYHVVGNGDGRWRVPVGGMGAVSAGLEQAARAAGADLRTHAEALAVDGAEVTWRDAAGEHTVSADHVLANCAPAVLDRLRGRTVQEPDGPGPGAQLKVNLLLDRLPRLRSGHDPDVAFAGTFRLDETASDLAAAHTQALRGELPTRVPAELYCHTLADPTIAPGRHTLTVFALHITPAMFADDEAAVARTLVDRLLDQLDEHLADPIRDCLALDANGAPCLEAKTPLDLERDLAMPGGNIFHGDLDWPWLEARDSDVWGVATDHPRIWRAGASARRGGGVSGIGGHNAAMAVLT